MNLAAATPSSAVQFAVLTVLLLVAVVLFVASQYLHVPGRRHSHSELVLGDVHRDLHAITAAIDGIPKVHVTRVDQQLGIIRAKRSLATIDIRVELRRADGNRMEVTVTIRTPGLLSGGIQQTLVRQVMQAIHSAQERLSRPKPPFGPSPVT
jgi:hypothetical protein